MTQVLTGDNFVDLQLLLMTVTVSILYTMTFTTYSVFVSKQTGNTLFLALYAVRHHVNVAKQKVGIGLGGFIARAIFFGHLSDISRQRRRFWPLATTAFQALISAAAAVRHWLSRKSEGPGVQGILTLLAFAKSGQIVNALQVSTSELNTTMFTEL